MIFFSRNRFYGIFFVEKTGGIWYNGTILFLGDEDMNEENTAAAKGFDTKRIQILSGSMLKLLALICMITDHVAGTVLYRMDIGTQPLFTLGSRTITLYRLCRYFGRLAFPLYCFLIAEGFRHTHDKKRYGATLLGFALISEIPWNLWITGKFTYAKQNVFFTLFLGFMALYVFERFKDKKEYQLAALIGVFAAAILIKSDYGAKGVAFILLIHVLRENKTAAAFIGSFVLKHTLLMMAAFGIIAMYNGERGFISGKAGKYFFYIIYPVHIFALYLVRLRFFGYE